MNEGFVSTAGRLLVAEPEMGDPNFDRTIVFMIDHTRDGAIGVVLNRPTDLPIRDVLTEWATYAAEPEVLFVGGPVSENAVIGLARRRADAPLPGWAQVADDIGTLDLHLDAVSMAGEIDALRLFAGYSGWGPGQLDFELDEGAWFIVDARPDDLFSAAPTELWRSVLRRQRDRLRLLADYPSDVTLN